MSTSAPVPSKHVFLHELPKQPEGTKVRFLCCVFEYDSTRGHLTVEHAYPHTATPIPRAIVDVNLILETLNAEILGNGRWVNIIGYVHAAPQANDRMKGKRVDSHWHNDGEVAAFVQAVLMWDAGAIRATEYERTMERQREAWKKTRHLHQVKS